MLENILEVLKGMNFRLRLGVVGSFARGDYNDESDIDIFVDGDMLSFDELDRIKNTIKQKFERDCDVIQSKLALEEDIELDKLSIAVCGHTNNESSYKNMIREVIWCNE